MEMANFGEVIPGFWSERVLAVTDDYEVRGFIFMPKTGKKNRILNDILNSSKRFVAIKEATIVHRKTSDRFTEDQAFIQLNLNDIIMIRPLKTGEC